MTFAAAKFGKFLPAAAFAMSVEFLMGLADSVISGHIVGEDGLSAVNLMQPVFGVVSFVSMLVGTGTGILYSTAMGRFDRRRASEMLSQGLWCTLGLGSILAVALFLLRGPVLDSFGASAEVRALAGDFWQWYIPCAVLEPLAFFFVSMCNADGDQKTSSMAYGVQLVGNCVASVPLTMKYGLSGCALGTVIGCILALAVLSSHFLSRSCSLRFVRHFSFADAGKIISCAAGDASVRICQAILFYILNFYVIARFGSEKLPVVAAVVVVLGLSEALDCIPAAAQPLVGVYLGERNDRLVRRVMRYACGASVAMGGLLTAVLVAFPWMAVKSVGIDDPALCADAEAAVRIVSAGLAGTALMVLYNSYAMFISKTALAAYVSILAALVAPCVLIFPLGAALGEKGVWIALGVAPFLACLAVAATVAWKWGRRSFPLFLDNMKIRRSRVFDLVLDEKTICDVAAEVGKFLSARTTPRGASLTSLLVEETLMTVRDRNLGGPRSRAARRPHGRIRAEVSIDVSDGISVIERDDGEIFDITDADAKATSFRAYFVSNLMMAIPARRNMTTTSFNRNVFRLGMETAN